MTTPTLTQVNIATQKADVEAEYRALVDAMTSDLPDVTSILMSKTTFTKADLIAKFASRITASEATKAARTALHTAVASERALALQVAPLRAQMKSFLALRFGKNSPEIQKFGFTQAKTPQKTVAAKATGVAKAKATRTARATKGKKQKSTIKGTLATAPTAATSTSSGAVATPAATSTASPATSVAAPAAKAASSTSTPVIIS